MKQFRLEFERTEVYVTKYEIIVDAETEQEARDIADEKIDWAGTEALVNVSKNGEDTWPVESELQFKRISEV